MLNPKVLLLFSSFILLPSAFPQGSLTPPGPPAPTMQTLDQLGTKVDQANTALTDTKTKLDQVSAKSDPRKPVTLSATSAFFIDKPGSYYLTGGLNGNGGLVIDSDDVTIDLMGFTLAGTGQSSTGIQIGVTGTGRNRVVIRNGTIRNVSSGIRVVAGSSNIVLEDLLIEGCSQDGIFFANTTGATQVTRSVVRRCRLIGNGSAGLRITTPNNGVPAQNVIDDCEATGNTSEGFAVFSVGNLIIRNRASGNQAAGNQTDYFIGVNNRAGAIVTPPTNNSILNNTGGGTGATDPFANLRY